MTPRQERTLTHAVESAAIGSRHPFQIFTLALCLFVGLPLLLGDAKPGTISASLPIWAENLWGFGLVLGSTVALSSLLYRNRAVGLLVEQLGLVLVGAATVFYAATVISAVGREGIVAATFVLGFGLSCLWRWVQLQRVLNAAHAIVKEANDG